MLLMHASIVLLGQWYLSFSLFSYPWHRDPSQIFVFVSTWLVNGGLGLTSVVVQLFTHSVVSDTLQPQTLQHARLPCPSPSPRACSNSCPLSQWCQTTILFSVIPFSFCLQSFPASGSFPVIQIFASGGQSIGASASASVLPMNSQDLFLVIFLPTILIPACGIKPSISCDVLCI